MELKQFFSTLWKWAWLIIACTAIAGVSAYLGVRNLPPVYQAIVTVRIGQALDQVNPTYYDFYTTEQLARTYVELVRRRSIMEGVARALNLSYVPGGASARLVQGTQLMEITFVDSDAARAEAIANEVANQLILQSPAASPEMQRDQDFIAAQLDDLKAKIDETNAKIKEEQANLDAANSARAIQQYQTNISALQQKLNTYQSTYASLRLNLPGAGANTITIVEPARAYPVGSGKMNTILLAAAIGAALAVGAAFLLEYLDDTVKTPEDVERVMGLTTLGAIMSIAGVEDRSDVLVTFKQPKAPASEAYRVLRTNLQFTNIGNAASALLVTSPSAGEGKTTLANVGVTLAQAGKRVVLVDTDLRRPALHRLFGLPNDLGLTSMLLDEQLLPDDVLKPTETPNLHVLCSGPRPPNPAELLEHPRLDHVIQMLKAEADYVLLDSPPVMAVADAVILSRKAQGVILVVDAGQTRSEICRRAVEMLQRVDARILGVVINKMTRQQGGYYYYYYYEGYDSGDGTQIKRRRHRRSWWERVFPFNLLRQRSGQQVSAQSSRPK